MQKIAPKVATPFYAGRAWGFFKADCMNAVKRASTSFWRETGVHHGSLSRCLSGKRDLPEEHAEKVLDSLGATDDEKCAYFAGRDAGNTNTALRQGMSSLASLEYDIEHADLSVGSDDIAYEITKRASDLLLRVGFLDVASSLAYKVFADLRACRNPNRRFIASWAGTILSTVMQVRGSYEGAIHYAAAADQCVGEDEPFRKFEASNTRLLAEITNCYMYPDSEIVRKHAYDFFNKHKRSTYDLWAEQRRSLDEKIKVNEIFNRDAARLFLAILNADPASAEPLRKYVERLEQVADLESDPQVRQIDYLVLAHGKAALGNGDAAQADFDNMLAGPALSNVLAAKADHVCAAIRLAQHNPDKAIKALRNAADKYMMCGHFTDYTYVSKCIRRLDGEVGAQLATV